jgi:hypothetical protein
VHLYNSDEDKESPFRQFLASNEENIVCSTAHLPGVRSLTNLSGGAAVEKKVLDYKTNLNNLNK